MTKNFRDEIYRTRRFSREELEAEIRAILGSIHADLSLTYPRLTEERENLLNEALIEIARNTRKHSSAQYFYLKYELMDSGFLILIGDDGVGEMLFKSGNFGLRSIDEVLKIISRDYQCTSDEEGTHFRIFFSQEVSE
jgi:signal transduction histidine kinase